MTGKRRSFHDNRGNVTSIGALRLVNDMTNRPIQMFGKSTGTNGSDGKRFYGQTHTYDAHQRRIKTVEGSASTVRYNVFDAAGTLVQVYDATSNIRTDYVSGPNGGLARIKRIAGVDEVSFLHADHLGTGRVGTSWGGAQEWEDWHTPFGESLIHPDETDDQSDYTGHIRDKATGLTYMQARYYDPVIGRFLAEDPMGMLDTNDPFQFNRYSYGNNDPINMLDPDGEDALSLTFDVDLVGVAVLNGIVPVGIGFSVGIVAEFEPRIPNRNSIIDGIADNPSNPFAALVDASTDITQVGAIVAGRGSTGIDYSAGIALDYTTEGVSTFDGVSLQGEGGYGPVAVNVSEAGTVNEKKAIKAEGGTTKKSLGVELGASALPASASVSIENAKTYTKEVTRSDFD